MFDVCQVQFLQSGMPERGAFDMERSKPPTGAGLMLAQHYMRLQMYRHVQCGQSYLYVMEHRLKRCE